MNRSSTVTKWLLLPILLLATILLTFQISSAQGKTFFWEQFDVDITVLENGDLRIVETQTLNFSGATFSFGFRGVPVGNFGNNDGITDFSVSEGGTAYTQSSSNRPLTFEVERESGEEVVRWYFEPTVGRHTYTIAYTVIGGIRVGTLEEGSGDQVFWKPTPTELAARVDRSTVTVRLPEGVLPQQFIDTTDYLVAAYIDGDEDSSVQINFSDDSRIITYTTTQPLIPGEVFEVRVQFPHGLLDIPTPDWQGREQRGDTIGLIVLGIALLIGVAGPLLVLALWYTSGRDPELGIAMPEYVSEPPGNLPPGIVGTLVDEKADMRDVISTLVDLARRGYITITEEKRDHIFARTEKPDDDLRPYERKFLGYILRGRSERSLKSLRYKFAEKIPKLRKMLYDELKEEGFVPRSPESVRGSYGCVSWLVLITAVGSFFALPAMFGETVATAVCPAFTIGLTGVVLLITSRFMPVKTRKGAEEAAKWDAFKSYLQNAERYGDLSEATDIFEKYIAYATAFGLERTWIRKFAHIPATPMPHWYGPYIGPGHSRPYHHGTSRPTSAHTSGPGAPSLEGMSKGMTGGLESMSSGLTRMLNSASTVMQSTRPSSTGGSSGGFSGGFSGGSSGGGGSAGFG